MRVHRTGGRYTFSIAAPLFFQRHLRSRPFDVIVEDLNKVPLFAPRWAPAPQVLLVHHLFGGVAFQSGSLPLATATWLLERPLAAAYRGVPVEAVSESTAQDLVRRGFRREDIVVIPNGVNLDYFTPAPDERFAEPTVLYLGRLKAYKRVDLLLRALARLQERGVRARLIVAGTGDQREPLLRLRARLGLVDHVELPGYVSEAEQLRLFRGAWVHALTSPKEGWGITNVEAAACATPTVASDSPGLRDSVIDGETGYLVPHGDVDALAERLGRILTDAGLRERLGRRAREFAAGFSWERAADRTEAHLQSIVRMRDAA